MLLSIRKRIFAPGFVVFVGLISLALAFAPAAESQAPPKHPKLAVLVLFDQLRGDYLTRWDCLFVEDGFHRLEKEGAWFQNCHYPYAHTVTATGHASVATGCSPDKNGIPGNEWFDRDMGALINCVAAEPLDRYQRVPPLPVKKDSAGKPVPKKIGSYSVSPEHLRAPSIGDAQAKATDGKGRIVSLSMKDRGAVLFAGMQPNASCYWFSTDTGTFVTSSYYRDKLQDWVEKFNNDKPADRWFGKEWTRLRPDLDYEKYSGPDDVKGEDQGIGFANKAGNGKGVSAFQGRTFPHPMTKGLDKVSKVYYETVYNSPFGNELLLDLAKRAIDAEKLGSRDMPDLLCLSFSSNDPIGHCWGPDSQEVLDVTLRTDLIVRDLLRYLDEKVGQGNYILALTADHGVCPLPEVSKSRHRDADRIDSRALAKKAEEFLDDQFGKNDGGTRWLEPAGFPWIYLNRNVLEKRKLKDAEIQEAVARWLEKQTGIQKAYTRTQLLQGLPKEDALGQSVLRSFYPDRCGDVVLVTKPYYLLFDRPTGTSHGTPHDYDTHVPLLAFGPSIKGGARKDAVTPQALAAILAKGLGIKPPDKADAPVPENLFTD